MQRYVEYLFRHIESKQRYNIDDPTCLKAIEKINELASKFIVELPNNVELYRAQLGCSLGKQKLGRVGKPPTDSSKYSWTPRPFDKNRMTPLAGITSSGRVSPKGIAGRHLGSVLVFAFTDLQLNLDGNCVRLQQF